MYTGTLERLFSATEDEAIEIISEADLRFAEG